MSHAERDDRGGSAALPVLRWWRGWIARGQRDLVRAAHRYGARGIHLHQRHRRVVRRDLPTVRGSAVPRPRQPDRSGVRRQPERHVLEHRDRARGQWLRLRSAAVGREHHHVLHGGIGPGVAEPADGHRGRRLDPGALPLLEHPDGRARLDEAPPRRQPDRAHRDLRKLAGDSLVQRLGGRSLRHVHPDEDLWRRTAAAWRRDRDPRERLGHRELDRRLGCHLVQPLFRPAERGHPGQLLDPAGRDAGDLRLLTVRAHRAQQRNDLLHRRDGRGLRWRESGSAGEIFIVDQGTPAIRVFSRTVTGSAAPLRSITGAATTLALPRGLSLDAADAEVAVADSSNVRVFSRTATGNVAPLRTFSTSSGSLVRVDATNGEIAVSDGSSIFFYSRAATGSPTALRSFQAIPSGGSTLFVYDFAVDAVNNEVLVVTGVSTAAPVQVQAFSRTATGTPTPSRTLTVLPSQATSYAALAVDT